VNDASRFPQLPHRVSSKPATGGSAHRRGGLVVAAGWLLLSCAGPASEKGPAPGRTESSGGSPATTASGGRAAAGTMGMGNADTGGAGGSSTSPARGGSSGAAGAGGSAAPTDAGVAPTPETGGSTLPPVQGQSRRVTTVAEFNQAVAASKPGDEIVFANGTYSDVVLNFTASGTEAAAITLRAETPGQVIFHGRSQLFIDGDWLVVHGLKYEAIADVPNITTPYDVVIGAVVTFRKTTNNSRMTETAIINSGGKVSSYFHMEPGGQHNRVDHCWFSGQQDIGPSLYIEVDPKKPNQAVMESCFVGNRKQGTGNRWETLRIGHSEQQNFTSGALVTRNYFTKCDGENEMVSNKSSGNKYLYNSFVDNHGELTLRHGNDTWIEGNYFENSTGIRVIGSRHVILSNYLKKTQFGFNIYAAEANPVPAGYTAVVDPIIAFNTIEDCASAFQIGTSGRPVAPKNVRVAYNLVQATGNILQYDNAASDVKYVGNIMYGGNLGGARPGIDGNKPALLTDNLGRLVADPAHLPMPVDASAFPQAAKDLNGTPRGATPNVGAIQAPNVKPLYPLSAKDVGPAWMGGVASAPPPQALVLSAVADPARATVEILLPYFDGQPVTITVLDSHGLPVRSLQARRDRLTWDGRDDAGNRVAAGAYLLSASVGGRAGAQAVQLP
jgi:poly(beta-D-mannuronate) lyase